MDQNSKEIQNFQIGHKPFINTDVAINVLDPQGDLVAKLKEEYGGLIITDFHDKDQIKVVHNAAQAVKKKRAEVNKTITSVKKVVADFQKVFKTEGGKILKDLDELSAKLIETRDDAKQKLADEAHALEMERLNKFNERAQLMYENGYTNNGVQFVVGASIVTAEGLEEIPEDDFQQILIGGKNEYDRIQQLMADAERLRKEEEERKAKEVEATPNIELPPSNATQVTPTKVYEGEKGRKYNEIMGGGNAPKDTPIIDDLPFGNETSFEKVEEKKEEDLEGMPMGYALGFEACKQQVKTIFETAPPMTREDLLNLVLSLECE